MTNVRGSLTSDYEFDLPPELIAQQPLAERSASRLMVVRRSEGRIEHRHFSDLVDLLDPRDLLVVNTSRVLKARLLGTRDGGGRSEVLLLKPLGGDRWEAMVAPGARLKPGKRVTIAPDFSVEILETTERHTRIVRLHVASTVDAAIEKSGHVPLPPYIERPDTSADADRYQTVYARETGSIAAPTAGLHFTDALLSKIAARGIARAGVVLHVGAGTFRPVEADDPAQHVMHEEWYSVPGETEAAVAATRARGGRVWAVGTTSARTLESASRDDRGIRSGEAETKLFVRPPYTFRVVDVLVTNFHLPKSTLLMLVSALGGYELMKEAYRQAVAERYRFFSYGDAMVVLP